MKLGGQDFNIFASFSISWVNWEVPTISDSRNLCIEIQLAHLICQAWSTLNLLQCQPPRFYFCACFWLFWFVIVWCDSVRERISCSLHTTCKWKVSRKLGVGPYHSFHVSVFVLCHLWVMLEWCKKIIFQDADLFFCTPVCLLALANLASGLCHPCTPL